MAEGQIDGLFFRNRHAGSFVIGVAQGSFAEVDNQLVQLLQLGAVGAAAGLNAVQNLQQGPGQLFVAFGFKTLGKFLQLFTTVAKIGHALSRPVAAR